MVADWERKLILDDEGLRSLLLECERILVLGIAPDSRRRRPAHTVPRFLQRVGYRILPVPGRPTAEPDILGEPIYTSIAEVPDPVDLILVFRRSEQIPVVASEIIRKRPRAVWLQLGIRHDVAARQMAEADIRVVQDRCVMTEHRKLFPGEH